MIFEIAGNVEYSYSDYEHLLGEQRQLINYNSGEVSEDIEM